MARRKYARMIKLGGKLVENTPENAAKAAELFEAKVKAEADANKAASKKGAATNNPKKGN